MMPFFEKKDTELFVYRYSDFGFPAHFHPSLEIVCAEEGEMGIVADGKSHLLHEGEIGVILPSRVHAYEYVPNARSHGFLVLIGTHLLGDWRRVAENMAAKNCVISKAELHPDCVYALERLAEMENESEEKQKAYVQMVMCHLFDKLETDGRMNGQEGDLYALVDYMEKHFRESISLETVAEALYINKYSLSRMFSRDLKMNFNDYLNNLRIHFAIECMKNGAKISEAGFEAGFNNLRTFNRAFAKLMKKTPSEYLKLHSGI